MAQVILVNEQDEAIGNMEKLEAHQTGSLHRAFSIFVFNGRGQMLLQQRAANKYHSAGLWSNACCGHPQPGEETAIAANRRLMEELGIEATLTHAFSFTYQAALENALSEHEIDHVFIAQYNGPLHANAAEVSSTRYDSLEAIKYQLQADPSAFTAWFALAFGRLEQYLAQHPLTVPHSPKQKAIVIGAGIAGMATACRLAMQGYQVDVYERQSEPGGKLGLVCRDGYRFDSGPSLFTQPELLQTLFTELGEKLEDYLQYEALPISCRYFFENGKIINAYRDTNLFANEAEKVAGEPPENLHAYLQASQQLYRRIGLLFLTRPLHSLRSWWSKKTLQALGALKWAYLFKSLSRYNGKKLKSPEMQQIFNRFATYTGSSPYQAPAMLSLIAHVEINEGAYYVKGGMISIAKALHQLAVKKGVQFFFNSPVEKLITDSGTLKGIVSGQQNKYAGLLVSTADVYHTWQQLSGNRHLADKLARQTAGSSAIIFYWGIAAVFEQLQLHNMFFSANYAGEFNCIFKERTVYTDPSIYLHVTSVQEAGHAPPGHQNWFVMINAPALAPGQNIDLAQVRKNIIAKLNRMLATDIELLITIEHIALPTDIQAQTNSYRGAIYGTASHGAKAAFCRQPNTTAIKGLYLCGGTVHPGGGIPLCLHSAAITAGLIAKKQGKRAHT